MLTHRSSIAHGLLQQPVANLVNLSIALSFGFCCCLLLLLLLVGVGTKPSASGVC
jgi:hypothetical protein